MNTTLQDIRARFPKDVQLFHRRDVERVTAGCVDLRASLSVRMQGVQFVSLAASIEHLPALPDGHMLGHRRWAAVIIALSLASPTIATQPVLRSGMIWATDGAKALAERGVVDIDFFADDATGAAFNGAVSHLLASYGSIPRTLAFVEIFSGCAGTASHVSRLGFKSMTFDVVDDAACQDICTVVFLGLETRPPPRQESMGHLNGKEVDEDDEDEDSEDSEEEEEG